MSRNILKSLATNQEYNIATRLPLSGILFTVSERDGKAMNVIIMVSVFLFIIAMLPIVYFLRRDVPYEFKQDSVLGPYRIKTKHNSWESYGKFWLSADGYDWRCIITGDPAHYFLSKRLIQKFELERTKNSYSDIAKYAKELES